tara:strand:- start:69 stop:404 length:336 start_codon:yes stop_codon:yes gene_type:complete
LLRWQSHTTRLHLKISRLYARVTERKIEMGELKKWREQKWVRIGTDGSILGACGTSKDKKNPDRCLPLKKARSMSKAERAATARKKKRAGAKGRTVVANTAAGKVTKKYTR